MSSRRVRSLRPWLGRTSIMSRRDPGERRACVPKGAETDVSARDGGRGTTASPSPARYQVPGSGGPYTNSKLFGRRPVVNARRLPPPICDPTPSFGVSSVPIISPNQPYSVGNDRLDPNNLHMGPTCRQWCIVGSTQPHRSSHTVPGTNVLATAAHWDQPMGFD